MSKPRTIHNADGSKIVVRSSRILPVDPPPPHVLDMPAPAETRSLLSRILTALFGGCWALLIVANVGAQNTIVSGGRAASPGDTVFISSDATSVAVGAGPVLSRRTVTNGKTLFLQHMDAYAYLITPSSTTVVSLGSLAIFSGGVRIATMTFMGGQALTPIWSMDYTPAIQISSGTVLTSSATANTASVGWITNFVGYEQ